MSDIRECLKRQKDAVVEAADVNKLFKADRKALVGMLKGNIADLESTLETLQAWLKDVEQEKTYLSLHSQAKATVKQFQYTAEDMKKAFKATQALSYKIDDNIGKTIPDDYEQGWTWKPYYK